VRLRIGAALAFLLLVPACRGASQSLPGAPAVLQLSSPAFADGAGIPVQFTCDGADVSPPLQWTGGSGVGTFALLVVDSDADDFVHWAVYDIPPSPSGSISSGALPTGAQEGVNSFGHAGYGGPCPPHGDSAHHYVFRLFELQPSGAPLPPGESASQVLDLVRKRALSQGTLIATYARA